MFKIIALVSLFIVPSAFANPMGMGGFGMPHPATSLCEDKGGETLVSQSHEGGKEAICKFDGGYIELITLYEKLTMGKNSQAIEAFESIQGARPEIGFARPGSPNPAARLCEEKGGAILLNTLTVRITGEVKTENYQTCVFSDQSEIGAWTLWHGKDHPLNAQLTSILQSGK